MCRCTPAKRTPYCGAPGCEWPPQHYQPPIIEVGPMSITDALKYADMMQSNGLTRRQHDAALQSLAAEVRRLQPIVAPEFGDTTNVK